MAAGSLEYNRPIGPWGVGILTFWWHRHDFNLGDTPSALSVGCTYAVAAGIASADYKHVLVFGRDTAIGRELKAGIYAVLLL